MNAPRKMTLQEFEQRLLDLITYAQILGLPKQAIGPALQAAQQRLDAKPVVWETAKPSEPKWT